MILAEKKKARVVRLENVTHNHLIITAIYNILEMEGTKIIGKYETQ